MKRQINKILVLVFLSNTLLSQSVDTNHIKYFKDRFVLYSDFGFTSAPFELKHSFSEEISTLSYKHNIRPNIGLGFSYKWLALRLSVPIIDNIRNVSKYGVTDNFNLGLRFTIKKFFCDLDFKRTTGYWLKNGINIDTTLDIDYPHLIFDELKALNFSASAWYFKNNNFNMIAFYGQKAHFKKPVHTWSVKGTMNFFGIGNEGSLIIPYQLVPDSSSRIGGVTYSAYDIGFIPGYAYGNRIKNWQFSALLGFGAVLQSKFYTTSYFTRGFLGIAPRYDFRMSFGYSNDNFFVFLVTELDNKSIQFTDLIYRQYYYSLRLKCGYRFKKK